MVSSIFSSSGNVNSISIWEAVWQFLKKKKYKDACSLSYSNFTLSYVLSKETLKRVSKKACLNVFIISLFKRLNIE